MNLILTLSNPDILPDSLRTRKIEFNESGGLIGRNQDCDWILEDPDRYVSSRHVKISFRDGTFYAEDTSTNGTFVNDELIGKGKKVPVGTGDVLRVGRFNISVKQKDGSGSVMNDSAASGNDLLADTLSGRGAPDPLLAASSSGGMGDDLLADPGTRSRIDPFLDSGSPSPAASDDLLSDAAPMSGVQDAMTGFELPSSPPAEAIPADWMSDKSKPAKAKSAKRTAAKTKAKAKPKPKPKPEPEPLLPTPPMAEKSVSEGFVAEEEAALDTGFNEDFALPDPTPLQPPAPQPAPRPAPQPTPVYQAPPVAAPAYAPAPATVDMGAADGAAFTQGFLQSTGLQANAATFETVAILGAVLKELLDGTLSSLDARNNMQEELRLKGTMVGARENNPLKFSINAQDAINRLLQGEATGFKAPVPAAREAMENINAHQFGVLNGIDAGIKALLEAMQPRKVLAGKVAVTGSGALGKMSTHHAEVTEQTVERRDGVFWRAFSNAYKMAVSTSLSQD